jgi:prepilin-type N-terminal cleavage/methylation domain-containing protein
MRQRPAIPRPRCLAARRGFTLIESALVAVIVGVGVMGTLQLVAAGTMANVDASKLTTATHLAGNVREMLIGVRFKESPASSSWGAEMDELSVVAYDDVDDFDGKTFEPPLDVRRVPLDSHPNWSQSVQVHSVDERGVGATLGKDNLNRPMSRVVVRVSHHSTPVYEMSWLVANTTPN